MKNQQQLSLLSEISQIPAGQEKRGCTDVLCILVGCIFTFVMVILGASLFNFNHYYRSNFPSDSEGRLCGIDDAARHYPYVYFTRPPTISSRVCVAQCPKPLDTKLECLPSDLIGCSFTASPGYEVSNYDNEETKTRSGYFCYPSDPILKEQLLASSKLSGRDQFYNSIDTITLCFYLSLAYCVVYLGCVQLFPKNTAYLIAVLGCLMIVASCICIAVYDSNQVLAKCLVILALLTIFFIIVGSAFRYQSSWRIHAILLAYSKNLVRDRCYILLYIPIFFVFLFFFLLVIIFEFAAFWSTGALTFAPQKQLFYELEGGGPITLTILLVFQAIWGFSFIKASCKYVGMIVNFCISCFAVEWYYDRKSSFMYPFKLLMFKHLGSVIGASFMFGFLGPIDFIFDAIKPAKNDKGCYGKCFSIFDFCTNIFDLVREDAISFLALTGNPYCNSSRCCEYLCQRSIIMDYPQSTSRSYRLCAHFLITGIMVIQALYIKGAISINSIFAVILLSLSTSTLFISLHCDIAEAMQTILLTDEELARRNRNLDYEVVDEESIQQQLQGLRLHGELVGLIRQQRVLQKKEKEVKEKEGRSES